MNRVSPWIYRKGPIGRQGLLMEHQKSSSSGALALAALGVVYGDIGTSPLYALKESLVHAGFDPAADVARQVYGPISLVFWSLTLMAAIKYLLILSHATNQGEGGMFALLSLLRTQKDGFGPKVVGFFVLCTLFGAALLYGDGMITPAISVLSAVEGLGELSDGLMRYVLPIATFILLALFLVQKHGTAKIGVSFGPVMVIWFFVLGGLGLWRIWERPEILSALSPYHGVYYLTHHGLHGVVIMGMVLLAVTGCEAMYADIGHFGRNAMQKAWFYLAYPALTLNYLGQGALILSDPTVVSNGSPFYRMAPQWMLIPMILLATMATIIASQAMITGVFSLTQQAVQLGYLPRLKIIHTNPDIRGQIYMPQVNFLLLGCCLALVWTFGSSSRLASAYGFSVAMGMLLTSVLFYFVARRVWGWRLWKAFVPVAVFVLIESTYVTGSLTKFFEGAWFPLVVAIGLWIVMKTWTDGRQVLFQAMQRGRLPVQYLVDEIRKDRIIRVPGAAVFMSASADGLPLSLLHHLKHNKALHQQVILLTVRFEDKPYVPAEERFTVEQECVEFYRVILRYGFSESPNVFDHLLEALGERTKIKKNTVTFYQSREILLTNGKGKMALWRKKLYVFLSRLSRPATGYFELPPRQVCELGIQLEM
jgi:KUP system potassium uptake protein